MLSTQYLQTIVTVIVASEITIRLSKDIYKTRQKQKTRSELIKLNWTVPDVANEIENKFFMKKYILFIYLSENKFFRLLAERINNPKVEFTIKSSGSIIVALVLALILTGVVLKRFSP
jgi:hypothetical protein